MTTRPINTSNSRRLRRSWWYSYSLLSITYKFDNRHVPWLYILWLPKDVFDISRHTSLLPLSIWRCRGDDLDTSSLYSSKGQTARALIVRRHYLQKFSILYRYLNHGLQARYLICLVDSPLEALELAYSSRPKKRTRYHNQQNIQRYISRKLQINDPMFIGLLILAVATGLTTLIDLFPEIAYTPPFRDTKYVSQCYPPLACLKLSGSGGCHPHSIHTGDLRRRGEYKLGKISHSLKVRNLPLSEVISKSSESNKEALTSSRVSTISIAQSFSSINSSPAHPRNRKKKSCFPSATAASDVQSFTRTSRNLISGKIHVRVYLAYRYLFWRNFPQKLGWKRRILSTQDPLQPHPPAILILAPSHIPSTASPKTRSLSPITSPPLSSPPPHPPRGTYRAYKNLTPKTRLGFGVAVLAWGGAGLYFSDRAEEKYQPTPEEKAVVDKYVPKVTVVDSERDGKHETVFTGCKI
ncbi:hypothetical protein CCUS01_05645 [Colletotrichum cuscutae]|uniref:Uncharacterized protein n=1 Tax=Colletotrichum cuscutae TaxID=1209917 RepID=A0AAI9VC30_9PEZI|nr:hypothetical protein CCUS01_05645 [Colletotrichum cuscutae]